MFLHRQSNISKDIKGISHILRIRIHRLIYNRNIEKLEKRRKDGVGKMRERYKYDCLYYKFSIYIFIRHFDIFIR